MSNHKITYVTPSRTKKIFRNMRRVGKGFSGRDTPLFPTMMVQAQHEQGEGSAMPTDPQYTPTIIQPSTSQPQLKQRSRRPKRKDTEVPQPSGPTDNVADEAVNEEMDEVLAEPEVIVKDVNLSVDEVTLAQALAALKNAKVQESSLGTKLTTPRSGEDSMKLKELIEFFTKLQQRVLDLENTKTAQAQEITRFVTCELRSLETIGGSRRTSEDASKQGRIVDIDVDAGINLVSTHFDADIDMFRVHDLVGDEVVVETKVASKDDKGKGKMVEPEPVKKIVKEKIIDAREVLAFKLTSEEGRCKACENKAHTKIEKQTLVSAYYGSVSTSFILITMRCLSGKESLLALFLYKSNKNVIGHLSRILVVFVYWLVGIIGLGNFS
ncbi:hypothetical protein Tco_0550985 [Tanacetum coccineum]